MQIISFAYVAPAINAGRKTVTRRAWDDAYAERFHEGQRIQAWDKSPRFGGKRIATIRLTANPTYEPMSDMPDEDYEGEGFAFLHETGVVPPKSSGFESFSFEAFEGWRSGGGWAWVIRFEIEEAIDGANSRGRERPH